MKNKVLKRMETYNALAEMTSQKTTVRIVMRYERYSIQKRIVIALLMVAVIVMTYLIFSWLRGAPFIVRASLSLYLGAIIAVVLYGAFSVFGASDSTYLPLSDKKAYGLLGQEITRVEHILAKAINGKEKLEPWLGRMSALATIVEEQELGYHWQYENIDACDEYHCFIVIKFSDEEFEIDFEVSEAGYDKMECDIVERIAGHWGLGRDSEDVSKILAEIRKLSGYTKDDAEVE